MTVLTKVTTVTVVTVDKIVTVSTVVIFFQVRLKMRHFYTYF